jgi:hypothetical protein
MIDAMDLAVGNEGSQLANSPPATAAQVENRVPLPDRDMLQSPIGQFGMPKVHCPQGEPAEPSCWFTALT